MRKPVLLIFANTCILIAIFALLTQSLFVVQRVAQVGPVHGKALVQPGGSGAFVPLAEGMTVKTGDVVHTTPKSSVELGWLDGTRWKLLGDSEAIIRQASYSSNGKFELSRLQLNQGKVVVRVARELPKDSRFEVETPTALTTSHGQVFCVQLAAGFTTIDVFKGSVDVVPSQGGSEIVATPIKRVVETSKGWEIIPIKENAPFLQEPEFTKPLLKAKVKALDSQHVLINGETEVGSRVMVDGKTIPVLGTGVFVRRVKTAPGTKSWKIESIDRYGQRNAIMAGLETMKSCL